MAHNSQTWQLQDILDIYTIELAYSQSGTNTPFGFYMKRLLSLACMILDQETLHNFTHNFINREFSKAIYTRVLNVLYVGGAQDYESRNGWGSHLTHFQNERTSGTSVKTIFIQKL